jgi:putative peptidoglycan lipid II flippase
MWKAWRQRSVNRRIFAATVTVGSFTLLVKLIALVKDLVVAAQFGTSDALDAFLIALVLPSFAAVVIAESLSPAFIPTYIKVREHQGREAAQRLFSSVIVWSSVGLIAFSALLALSAPYTLPIVASGFSPEKLALTRSLFYILLPTLVLSGLATIWSAVLNAGERFALAAITPIMTPLMMIVFLLLTGRVWGIYSLVGGSLSGLILQGALLVWGLRRQGLSLTPRWYGWEAATRQVSSQYAPMIAGSFMVSSTTLVDQSMAAMLGSGSVSALNYGIKMVTAITSIGTVALSTAVLPHFSRMVAVRDWDGIGHTMRTYARLILLVTVPITLGLVYFSEPLVRLLFERGAFTAADTHLVGQVQALFLLQIPFYTLGMLLVRLISSLQGNHLLMWGSALNLSVNVSMNYVLGLWLGVAGIALATSLVYLISFCYLAYVSRRLLKRRATHEQG